MQKNIQTSLLAPYKTFFIQRKSQVTCKCFYCQFLYAPLIWMFSNKSSINKICKIHFRTLQIVHNVYDKSHEELLAVSNDISVYQNTFAYKSLMKTNPHFMRDFYTIRPILCDSRFGEKLYLPTVNTKRCGLNSLIFRGSLLWNNLPTSTKINQSLADFKNILRHFGKIDCTCVVCRW